MPDGAIHQYLGALYPDELLTPGSGFRTRHGAAAAVLAALGAWRTTQGIYRCDPTIFDALWDTPVTGELPAEVLLRLPEWCCYIETPERTYRGRKAFGFFVHLDWSLGYTDTPPDAQASGVPWLRFLVDHGEQIDCTVPIPLVGTLEKGIAVWLHDAIEQARRRGEAPESIKEKLPEKFAGEIAPLISLTLYLCSQNAEVRDRRGLKLRPSKPPATHTKQGPRFFPPDRPTTWEVGWRIGAAIRAAEAAPARRDRGGTHASPRPHIRRAHWHSFWTGPRAKVGVAPETERELVLRWLPPIPVNVDEDHELPSGRICAGLMPVRAGAGLTLAPRGFWICERRVSS